MVTGLNILGQNKALQDHEIKRVIAYIIDWVIVWIVSGFIAFLIFASIWAVNPWGVIFFGGGTLISALLALLYWVLFEAFMGGTIGKKVMGLQVVGTTGPLDIVKSLIRNLTKVHPLLVFLDWIIGLATEGDPRQKIFDRFAGTTVVRTDAQAYMEEQFRQMATPPPHPAVPQAYGPQPAYPPPAYGQPQGYPQQPPQGYQQPPPQGYQQQPPQQAPPPAQPAPQQQPPPQQTWPGQQQQPPAGGGWPQHQWDQQGQLVQQPRFCQNCGGPLVARGDGRLACSRCGAVF